MVKTNIRLGKNNELLAEKLEEVIATGVTLKDCFDSRRPLRRFQRTFAVSFEIIKSFGCTDIFLENFTIEENDLLKIVHTCVGFDDGCGNYDSYRRTVTLIFKQVGFDYVLVNYLIKSN